MNKSLTSPQLPIDHPLLKGTDKRSLILRAAMVLFLRDGYSRTSMDAVTAEAGVSKATVYAYFPGKQQLLQTLMQEGSAASFSQFPRLLRGGGTPAEELTNFFGAVLDAIIDGIGHAWDRMIISEATHHPDNAKLFHSFTFERLGGVLKDYLEALALEGWDIGPDPARQAGLLVSMVVIGPVHTHLILGDGAPDRTIEIKAGIDLFLKACQPR